MGRWGGGEFKAQTKEEGYENRAPPVFLLWWLFSNVSGRITGMGTWFSKWLRQWLWFHGNDTVALYVSCCFGDLSIPCRAFCLERRVSADKTQSPSVLSEENQSGHGHFWWALWSPPMPQTQGTRGLKLWYWELHFLTLSRPGITLSLSHTLLGNSDMAHRPSPHRVCPRAEKVHILKRLFLTTKIKRKEEDDNMQQISWVACKA